MKRGVALLAVVALGCTDAPISEETRARESYLRRLAEREGVLDAWYLMSRSELVFEDGFSLTEMTPPTPLPRWTDETIAIGSVRSIAARWMTARAHLRVRGRGDMRLALWGQVQAVAIATRPRLTVSFDGLEIAALVVDVDGRFTVDTVIPGTWLDGWSDIDVRLSSIHEPWRSVRDLRVARLEGVTWEPLP